MGIFVGILGSLLIGWVFIEVYWAKTGARCDCDHRWATAVGDSAARNQGGRLYSCLRCGRSLIRASDVWPPSCGDPGGPQDDCGWPMCSPLRRPGDLPRRAYRVANRMIWHGVDAPE